jgi:uncharacterized membrane protein YbhN (UPF0104 family)
MKSRLILVLKIAAVLVIAWLLWQVIKDIDWAEVWESLAKLTLAQVLLMLALVLIRQILNAIPLAMFVPDMTVKQSTVSDLSAGLIATTAPPPGDAVLRLAMFRSWNIPLESGMAGFTLNMVIYYVLRFAAPVVGFLTLFVASRFDDEYAVVALISGAVALLIAGAIVSVVRSKRLAAIIGRSSGRVLKKFKPDKVDPEQWASRVVEFRGTIQVALKAGWSKAALALVTMLAVEGVLLLISMRAMGVPASAIAGIEIVAAFLIAYPLTALPFSGLGILDLAILKMLGGLGAEAYESQAVAALVVWRMATLVLPLLLGVLALLGWRRKSGVTESLNELEEQEKEADTLNVAASPNEPQAADHEDDPNPG